PSYITAKTLEYRPHRIENARKPKSVPGMVLSTAGRDVRKAPAERPGSIEAWVDEGRPGDSDSGDWGPGNSGPGNSRGKRVRFMLARPAMRSNQAPRCGQPASRRRPVGAIRR